MEHFWKRSMYGTGNFRKETVNILGQFWKNCERYGAILEDNFVAFFPPISIKVLFSTRRSKAVKC
jgi:hypothetical protein